MVATVQIEGNGRHIEAHKQFDMTLLDHDHDIFDIPDLGAGLKLTKKEEIDLTEDAAKGFLELADWAPDRGLDDNHVVYLKSTMERGTFMPEQVIITTCSLNRVTYRMNGQHTCWARYLLGNPKYRCVVRHHHYVAASEADVRMLYASIDRNKARTKANVIVAYLYGTKEWEGQWKDELKLLAEGMSFWKWPLDHVRKRHDGDDRAYLLQTEHNSLGRTVGAFMIDSRSAGKNAFHIRRSPVVAAMFATFEKSATDSINFWTPVRDGVGLDSAYDPRLQLRNKLMSTAMNKGKGPSTGRTLASSEEMFRWCIYAWNVFRRGGQMKQLKANLKSDRPNVE